MQGASDVDQLDLPERLCELGDHGLRRDQSVLTDNRLDDCELRETPGSVWRVDTQ
jgi:hypothetical protein